MGKLNLPPVQKTGMAAGLNRGHVTTRKHLAPKPVNKKGPSIMLAAFPEPLMYCALLALGKRTKFVRDLVREVVGFAPYEKRVMELLKNSNDKRARKLAKKRLGTLRRAKRKVEDLSNSLQSLAVLPLVQPTKESK
ncbi:hypothetical protein BASA60_006289 [Batrachochytrium salamandrivorans]|nr:hypothetical protein BASA60_006289 [Batrachochytrium salamandrivorans]